MKVGPTFVKIGKAVLYPIDELEAWDRKNMVTCRASKQLTTDLRDVIITQRHAKPLPIAAPNAIV
jgi:hypothetical protein